MTIIQKNALVKFSAQQMFDLVNNIEAYPQFLPWCSGSRIIKREDDIVEAELLIAKGGFKKTFSTRNRIDCFFSCMINPRMKGASTRAVASTSTSQVSTDRLMILEKIFQSLYALSLMIPSFYC